MMKCVSELGRCSQMVALHVNYVLFVLFCSKISAYPDMAGSCHSGGSIGGGFHGTQNSGSLEKGNIQIYIDDQKLTAEKNILFSNTAYTLDLNRGNGGFQGFLIRASSSAEDDLDVSSVLTAKSQNSQDEPFVGLYCDPGVSAVTHRASAIDDTVTALINFGSAAVIDLEVTVMVNVATDEYYYSTYELQFQEPTNALDTIQPTISPSVGLISVNPTVAQVVPPSDMPSPNPSTILSSSPSVMHSKEPTQIPSVFPFSKPSPSPNVNHLTSNPTPSPIDVRGQLIAQMGKYPEYAGDLKAEGVVRVSFDAVGSSGILDYAMLNLPPVCTECGVHIHEGTSCDSATAVGDYYWNKTKIEADPWVLASGASYTTVEDGSAIGFFKFNNGFKVDGNYGHAVVFHAQNGTGVSCGVLVTDIDASPVTNSPAIAVAPLPPNFPIPGGPVASSAPVSLTQQPTTRSYAPTLRNGNNLSPHPTLLAGYQGASSHPSCVNEGGKGGGKGSYFDDKRKLQQEIVASNNGRSLTSESSRSTKSPSYSRKSKHRHTKPPSVLKSHKKHSSKSTKCLQSGDTRVDANDSSAATNFIFGSKIHGFFVALVVAVFIY
mmetsp:Transcript_29814/g.43766  ORF Transcript_29814/g.43766 Transcript_29814/m.43766 type:complete len:603 (-) Transcript_29814:2273-4081(-)